MDEIKTPPIVVDIDRDKIRRAVKEALDDKAIEDLGKQLTNLSSQMTEGFAQIHTRQDIANGKLMKHESRLDADEEKIRILQQHEITPTFLERNQDKVVWGIVGVVLMLFYYLLTHNGFPAFL